MAFGSWNKKISEGDKNMMNKIHGGPAPLIMNKDKVEQLSGQMNRIRDQNQLSGQTYQLPQSNPRNLIRLLPDGQPPHQKGLLRK